MDKIRAIIVDDEPLARRGVRQLLAPHSDIFIVAEARNGNEAVQMVKKIKPDLLFLDVQMPELDGFGVLGEIGATQMPAVIFVTAHDEFAVRAFDAHALDYLVKPLETNRFAEALERMRQQLRSANAIDLSRKLAALLASREQERARQRIRVTTAMGDLIIEADEIDWIEADDYYAAIHARAGRHLVRESLASLAERLDKARFVRAHRSAIINIDRVTQLRHKDGETAIILRDGTCVPVSRRRRASVSRILRHLQQ
jgi:two-component system, LytTR family, response regulator